MGLRMKIFNIVGFTEKIDFKGGRGHENTKNQYIADNFLKRGAWQVCRFRGVAWQRRGG